MTDNTKHLESGWKKRSEEAREKAFKAIEKINNANREKSNAPKESIALHEKLDQLITEIENF